VSGLLLIETCGRDLRDEARDHDHALWRSEFAGSGLSRSSAPQELRFKASVLPVAPAYPEVTSARRPAA
jgi:hypothetical protein